MDTTRLRELAEAEGPFASVYFEDSHDTEDAEKQLELKRREIREALSAQGAEQPLIEAVDQALRTGKPPVGRSGRAVLATRDGRVLLDERLAEPPGPAQVRYSPLPHLLPLLAHSPGVAPHLVVVVDQTGADVTVVDPTGKTTVERVSGSDEPVHKVRGGGEAHYSMQNRVEETVQRNLELVAQRTGALAVENRAELLVLAGEVQSRRAVRELLPKAAKDIATEVTGSTRTDAGTGEQLAAAVDEALVGHRLARLDEAAGRFRAESGRAAGLAVSGLEGVTAALREANVETLLLTDPGEATVAVGSSPAQLAVNSAELRAFGEDNAKQLRADEVLPVAALTVGADVIVLDERLELTEGVGAILRHT